MSEIELFHDKITYDNFKNGITQLLHSIDILEKALKSLPVHDITTIRLTNANLFERNIYNNLKNLENIDDHLSNKVMRQLENNKITIEHLTNLVTTKNPTILDFLNKCSGCSTKLENEKDKIVTISQVGKYNTNIVIHLNTFEQCTNRSIIEVYPLAGQKNYHYLSGKFIRTTTECYELKDKHEQTIHLNANIINNCCNNFFNVKPMTNCSTNNLMDFQTKLLNGTYILLNLVNNTQATYCDKEIEVKNPIVMDLNQAPNCTLLTETYEVSITGKGYEIIDNNFEEIKIVETSWFLPTFTTWLPLITSIGTLATVIGVLIPIVYFCCKCKNQKRNENDALELQPMQPVQLYPTPIIKRNAQGTSYSYNTPSTTKAIIQLNDGISVRDRTGDLLRPAGILQLNNIRSDKMISRYKSSASSTTSESEH